MDALRNLAVWQRACRFTVDIYELLSDCRDYGFKDQLSRSALSIASNIAEGYDRESGKDRVRLLRIAQSLFHWIGMRNDDFDTLIHFDNLVHNARFPRRRGSTLIAAVVCNYWTGRRNQYRC